MSDFGTGNHNNKIRGRKLMKTVARGPRLVLPALAALGIGGPAAALELGPVKVHSALGEPLRASIAFALRPHEEIAPYCIRVAPGRSATGLPALGPASVALRNGAIELQGHAPVAEPLAALQLTVDCPYAAHLSREYFVLVDPEQPIGATTAVQPREAALPATRRAAVTRPGDSRAATAPGSVVSAGTTWRVQRGDTLSGIAARIEGRQVGLWQAVDLLFDANPDAFIDNDRNLLRSGVLLRIPDVLYAAEGPAAGDPPTAETSASQPDASSAYGGYAGAGIADPAATAPAPNTLFLDGTSRAPVSGSAGITAPRQAAASQAPSSTTAAARPDTQLPASDVVPTDELFVSPIEGEDRFVVLPDAVPTDARPLVEPAGIDGTPAPIARAAPDQGRGGARVWLFRLAGTGVALILALLFFGRMLKRRFGGARELAAPDGVAQPDDRPSPGMDTALDAEDVHVDFRFDDANADARIVRVDVDLDDGTGFRESEDIDVAQDFGFSASGGMELGLDVDFSEESPAMLGPAPRRRAGEVIVESEIPPGDTAAGEYDLSMIVDATRQPLDDMDDMDDTEKDLHAIELEEAVTEPEEDPYTLSQEVDYKILEQDYEEELTATQALNAELSHAARDLVDRLYDRPGEIALHDLPTAEMPGPGTEPTALLPRAAGADESATTEMVPGSAMAEGGDTDVNENLAVLPEAGNDESADMEVERPTIDTKKLKAS